MVDTATGIVVQRRDDDAWGNVLLDTTPGFQPFGFAGGLDDPDTRLVRFGARDYDPQTGRWTAKDPIGFWGGRSSLYVYAQNNPVSFVDPDGRLFAPAAIGFAIGAAYGAYAAAQAGGNWNDILRSATVGGLAGALSTLPIPGLNIARSGALMGGVAGFTGNLAAQVFVEGKSLECVDYGSAGRSALAGALGGGLGGGVAGVRMPRILSPYSASRGPIFTQYGQGVVGASAGGVFAGGLDVAFH